MNISLAFARREFHYLHHDRQGNHILKLQNYSLPPFSAARKAESAHTPSCAYIASVGAGSYRAEQLRIAQYRSIGVIFKLHQQQMGCPNSVLVLLLIPCGPVYKKMELHACTNIASERNPSTILRLIHVGEVKKSKRHLSINSPSRY